MNRFLSYGRQSIDRTDIDAVVGVLNSDFLTQGPVVGKFEEYLANQVGAKYAVAVSSGTAALHVACLAAGIGPGRRGITSTLTFVASANSFLYCGADAMAVDIDRSTLTLSESCLRGAIDKAPDIAVVMPVHFAGFAADAASIREIAGDRVVIEDAAHSLGASYTDGQPVGSCAYADMSVFSFHPVKSITSAEGGAITTNNPEYYRRLKLYANHGIERDDSRIENMALAFDETCKNEWYYEQQALGFNYRMSDLHAALGLSQLKRLPEFIARRREITARYDEAFETIPTITPMQASTEARSHSALHIYPVEVDFDALGLSRREFLHQLSIFSVGGQVHYIPVHRHPYQRGRYDYDPQCFPEAEGYFSRCLTLPLHADMSDEEVARVIEAITSVSTMPAASSQTGS